MFEVGADGTRSWACGNGFHVVGVLVSVGVKGACTGDCGCVFHVIVVYLGLGAEGSCAGSNGVQVGVVGLWGRGVSRWCVDDAVGSHVGILEGVEAVLVSGRLAMAHFSEMSKADPRMLDICT